MESVTKYRVTTLPHNVKFPDDSLTFCSTPPRQSAC